MSDLVKQLRSDYVCLHETCGMCDEAADRIEALEAALRSAIEDLEWHGAVEEAIRCRAALAEGQDK